MQALKVQASASGVGEIPTALYKIGGAFKPNVDSGVSENNSSNPGGSERSSVAAHRVSKLHFCPQGEPR